ncbi:hypothetical protein E9229_001329 [Paeniglutamicibacter cryotolerans]|uniref:Uncharacterized protein n=1 Tax=Paeniglutamicibacter cryotolerans TaxID=670079 RepID=A0A839QFS4_9MICC|nr:hypothetical protein [Paeniglutamicibacter cryotolerans]MBB2995138.1 hypothetical protein [Paeniglutamicibacter cryotolerans]
MTNRPSGRSSKRIRMSLMVAEALNGGWTSGRATMPGRGSTAKFSWESSWPVILSQ